MGAALKFMRLENLDEITVRKFLDDKGKITGLTFVPPLREHESEDPECIAYLSVLANAPDNIEIGSSKYSRSNQEGHVCFEALKTRHIKSIDITYRKK